MTREIFLCCGFRVRLAFFRFLDSSIEECGVQYEIGIGVLARQRDAGGIQSMPEFQQIVPPGTVVKKIKQIEENKGNYIKTHIPPSGSIDIPVNLVLDKNEERKKEVRRAHLVPAALSFTLSYRLR